MLSGSRSPGAFRPRALLASCRCAMEPRVLRTNLLIALGVGIVLSLANQYDVIRRTPVNTRLVAKIIANFLVPFLVSTLSVVVNQRHSKNGSVG
jgi:hypothetical protein